MPIVPQISGARETARALRGLSPDDIDPDEMDRTLMRIFNELTRQLAQMEAKKAEQLDTTDRERNARILASLERTAERLVKLEAERSAARKSKAAIIDGHATEILDARIHRIVAAANKAARAEIAEGEVRKSHSDGVEARSASGSASA